MPVAYGTARDRVDLNETALRKAVEQHRALKAALKAAGIPVVPLLLVQAASTEWTPARVRDLLRGPLGFPEGAVATNTADEPDPDVQALANDPAVEVLVFKMAVATGFDAPRAFSLCALRPVVDANFGLQVVGRIMRVHPLLQTRTDLPPGLETGWVFLGDAEGQTGLQAAADRIKAIRDSIQFTTDDVTVYEAGVGGDGRISVVGSDGQAVLVLEAPPEPRIGATGSSSDRVPPLQPSQPLRIDDTLFGQLSEMQASLNVVLVQSPALLKDALRRATQACAEVVDAADLPAEWESLEPLPASDRNLYGVFPAGMNTWERRFASWLDHEPKVVWWLRNLPRPAALDDWSARIVLPDSGKGFYPDFVVCIEARRQRDGIALAETKERTETEDSAVKSRTEHREYGRAVMLRYDIRADRFIRVEYAPEFGRNKEVGPFRAEDLLE